jgi:hypothetical protein
VAGPTAVEPWGWWKADAITASDNDAVATWPDSSGNARDLTSGTGIYKANIQNGLPIVRFDGVDDSYVVPDLSALTAGTVFIVVRVDNDPPGAAGQTGLWGLGTDSNSTHFPYTDSVIYDQFGTTARKTTGDPTVSLSAGFVVYNAISAAADWRSYLNNTLHFSTGTNTVGFTFAPRLGSDLGANVRLDGDVGEWVLYDSALSDTDRVDVFTALNNKWITGGGAQQTAIWPYNRQGPF